jgi:photosystem II stability/assembly factor-like uncharacterized protein
MTDSIYKALRIAKLFLLLLLFTLFFSCKKSKLATIEWTKINSGTSLDLKSIFSFNLSDTVFVCGGNREKEGIVMRSVDKGNSWQTVLQSNSISFNQLYFKNSQLGFVLGDFADIYKTTDGGNSWKHCVFRDSVSFNFKVVLRSIEFINDSVAFVCGGDDFGNGIILKTTDNGENWTSIVTEDHELRSLDFVSSLHAFSCGYGLLLESNNGGSTWDTKDFDNEFLTAIHFIDQSTGYLCSFDGSIYKTSNAGSNWEKLLKGNAFLSSKRYHFNCMDVLTNETIMAAGEEGYAMLSQDDGKTWLRASMNDSNTIHQILLTSSNSGWAVTDKGGIYQFELL